VGSEHSQDERPTVELGSHGHSSSGQDEVSTAEPLGLDSEVALARARGKLAGREQIPVAVGRYRILERLGRGGMGVVYAARDDELERTVAIKILHAAAAHSEDGRRRLLREAQAMARLSHPNVGHVYEVGRHGDQVFLAMERVCGVTLRQWCTAPGRTWRDVLRVHVAAGEGLAAAHAVGLVHRDYKSENVIVADDGRPRVLDFGLARPDHLSGPTVASDAWQVDDGRTGPRAAISMSDEITRAGTVIGTPAYMAPEQLAGNTVDARADQFSFCVALFECLYGQRPFRGTTVSTLVESVTRDPPAHVDVRAAGVPRAVHAAILRGLRPEPTRRHASMEHLLAVLRDELGSRPRAKKIAWLAGTGLAAVVGTGAAWAAMSGPSAPTSVATAASEPALPRDAWAEIVAGSELPPVVEQPLVGDPTAMTVHRLPNGLTVYVASRPGEPFIEAHIVVRATSDDEPPGDEGLAELTMWAVEAGSQRVGTRDFERERPHLERQHELLDQLATETSEPARAEIMRRISAAQDAAKGVANPDEVHALLAQLGVRDQRTAVGMSLVAADVPRNRFDAWVAVAAEMLRRPVFRNLGSIAAGKLEFDRYWAENDSAYTVAARELPRGAGYEDRVRAAETLSRLPLADVKRFHETYYRPNNTAIVLVGDMTAAEAMPVIADAFGDWEPAEIPKPARAELPMAGKRTIEVEDGGSPAVHLVWPLPPPTSAERPAYDDLAAALGGPDGVLGRVLRDHGVDLEPELESWPHIFAIIVHPNRGLSLPDAEAALFAALRTIADDAAPDDAWTRALARQELEASRWASSSDALADLVSDSFSDRRAWADVAAHLARPMASRTALVAAARELLGRGMLVVHQSTGEPSTLPVDPLPFPPPAHDDTLGPWGRALLESPVTPLEPQFLAAGRHFEESRRGAGRVVTAKDTGPLFRLEWVYPRGVASDPWACDAVRAQIAAHERDEGLRGLDIHAVCRPEATSIEVLGVAARFDEVWPGLAELVQHGAPDAASVRDHVEETLALRAEVRTHAIARTEALHAHALFGEHGVDGGMPDDATFERTGASAVPRAWASLRALAPDVLYVGPRPERVRELLAPVPADAIAPREPIAFRELDRPTVFVLPDPGREQADIRVALVGPGTDARARLLGRMFEAYPATDPAPDGTAWHPAGLSPLDPRFVEGKSVHVRGYRCATRDVPRCIGVALRTLRVEPTREGFAVARARLESGFRGYRIAAADVPADVRTWPLLGSAVDPRLEPWLALGGLDFAAYVEHTEALAQVVPIISVVADPDVLDDDALALHGRVVRVPIDALLRDPDLADMEIYEYPAE
jgi:predicted Zn-dependent peptidase